LDNKFVIKLVFPSNIYVHLSSNGVEPICGQKFPVFKDGPWQVKDRYEVTCPKCIEVMAKELEEELENRE